MAVLFVSLLLSQVPGTALPPGPEPSEIAARLELVSRPWVGAPYELSPLGEGEGPDDDPRLRFDRFDCTTFVETAMALAYSYGLDVDADKQEAEDVALAWLDRIRYADAQPRFEKRRHLVVAQWLPGLQAERLLVENSEHAAGQPLLTVDLVLDEKRWLGRTIARELDLALEHVPQGRYELPYVALDDVETVLSEAEPGQVINIVRVPTPNAPIVITHQALLLRSARGTLVIRHASAAYRRVVDQTVEEFAADLRRPRSWPVAGVNLQRVIAGTRKKGMP